MTWPPWRGRWGEGGPREAPDSDARRLVLPRVEAEAPETARRLRLRRRALVLAVALPVALGTLVAVVGNGGLLDARRLKRQLRQLEADVALRETEVSRLRDEVARLAGDPLATERAAREDLGYVLPGEIDFLLPRSPSPLDESEAGAPPAP